MSAASREAMAAQLLSPRSATSAPRQRYRPRYDRLDAELADDVAALAERVDVALDRLDVGKLGAARRHQLMMDRQKPFADDEQAGLRQQMMDVGDAAGDRVFDRDHAEVGFARRDRGERVLEGRAGQRLGVGIGLDAWRYGNSRPARPGMRFSLRAWSWRLLSATQPFASIAGRFRDRPAYRRRAAPYPRSSTSIRMPASSARSCSSFSRLFQRRGRQRDEALQRRAAIGVEADVMVARPLALGRGGAGEIQRAQPARATASPRPSPHWDWCVLRRYGFRRPALRYRRLDRRAA